MKNRRRLFMAGYVILVFLGLFIFFIRIHPLIIYDTDDWLYVAYARKAVPLWGDWNPSRIFPEIVMPFMASLGVYLIYPFTHDYVGSIAFMYGVILSVCITLYVYFVMKSLTVKIKLSLRWSACVSVVFLLLNFLIFRSSDSDNVYMFHSFSCTNYFYYTIPTIFNIIIVLILILKPELVRVDGQKDVWNYSFIILAIYLCIFSNLFCSYILAIWAGVRVLFELFEQIKSPKRNMKISLKNMTGYLLILGFWFISMIYELSGGRADSLQEDSYIHNLITTLKLFVSFLKEKCNGLFVGMLIVTVCMAIFFSINRSTKEEFKKLYVEIFLNFILAVLYVVLICAKTSPDYICRTDVLLGISFWLLYAMVFCFSYWIKKREKIALIIPLMVCIMFFEINVPGRTYKDSNQGEIDWNTAYLIDNDIIAQIQDAVRSGKTEMELYVPKSLTNEDNWPIALYGGNHFSQSLYKHGIISRMINITLIPSEEFNQKYNIDMSEQ